MLELAGSRLLDPATSLVLAAAAHEARTAGPEEREHAESDLSRALRAVVDQERFRERLVAAPGGPDLLEELGAAVAKVVYSRRFYNNAVGVTRTAQRRWLARTSAPGRAHRVSANSSKSTTIRPQALTAAGPHDARCRSVMTHR